MKIKIKEFLLSLLIIGVLLGSCWAGYGSSGWVIFKKIQAPEFRAVAAASPRSTGISSVLYNPAAVATLHNKELLLTSESGMDDTRLGAIFFGMPAGKGIVSFGAAYFDAGSVELNWLESGALRSQTVSAQRDYFGMASIEYPLSGNIFAGLSLKGAQSEIAERCSANAFAGDFGLFYLPAKNISLSFAVQNIGCAGKFIEKEDPLPAGAYLGSGYVWEKGISRLIACAGATYHINDQAILPEIGMEMGYGFVSMNAGYRISAEESNLHFGLGLRTGDTTFSYAFIPGVYLDDTHRLSVSYAFAAPHHSGKKSGSSRKRFQGKKNSFSFNSFKN